MRILGLAREPQRGHGGKGGIARIVWPSIFSAWDSAEKIGMPH